MLKYPMRINQYLAKQKKATRRDADMFIQKKRVFINGKLAVLGDKVNENDKVEVRALIKPKKYIYMAYNKPKGQVTGEGLLIEKNIFPLGRLDQDSEGLMILTNDGRITDGLLNPEFGHEKEYIVTVSEKLRPNFKEKMEAGVNIEGYKTRPCKVNILSEYTFKIILTEGKKHQIRRMCVALFNQVKHLKRIRIMNIKLENLASGSYREIQGRELEIFLTSLLAPVQ